MKTENLPLILVVDDDHDELRIIERILVRNGYKVDISTNGEDTLKYLEENTPILIILDVHLGIESGYDILKKIKENPKTSDQSVVLISSMLKHTSDKIHGYESGAETYITRPIAKEELLAIVAAFVKQRKVLDELRAKSNELIESHRLIGASLGNLPGMVYKCLNDNSYTMKFLSNGCKSLTGYEPEELINNSVISYNELIHEDDQEFIHKAIPEAKKNNNYFEIKYRIRTKSGEIKWLFEKGRIKRDNENKEFLEGFIIDITPEKLTEDKLLLINKNIGEIVFELDEDLNISFISPSVYSKSGYNSEEVIGKDLSLFIGEENSKSLYNEVVEKIKNNENEISVIRTSKFKTKFDSEIIVELKLRVSNKAEDSKSYEGIIRDVTDLKLNEEKYYKSDRKFKSYFDANPTPVFIWHVDNERITLKDLNLAATELSGFERERENIIVPGDLFNSSSAISNYVLECYKLKNTIKKDFSYSTGDSEETIYKENTFSYIAPDYVVQFCEDITQKKSAESKLIERERKYRAIFELSPIAFWEEDISEINMAFEKLRYKGVRDLRKYFNENPNELLGMIKKLKILNVNQACLELLKADNTEQLLNNLDKTFTESSFDVFTDELQVLYDNEESFSSSGQVKTLEGNIKDVIIQLFPLSKNRFGKIEKIIAAITDISDLLKTKKKLGASDQKFMDLTASLPQTIFITNKEGKIQYINHPIPPMTQEELIGHHYEEFIDTNHDKKRCETIKTELKPIKYDKVYNNGIGEYFLEVNIIPRTYKEEFQGFIFVLNDITERKKYEIAIRTSEKKYRDLVNNSNSVVMLLDRNGKIQFASQFQQELLGYLDNEIIENPYFDYIYEEDRNRITDEFNEAVKRDFVRNFEYRLKKKDDEYIWVKTILKPIKNENSEITEVQLVSFDISERIGLVKDLKKRIAEVEAFNSTMVGREMTMIEMKQEINSLLKELGRKEKYDLGFLNKKGE